MKKLSFKDRKKLILIIFIVLIALVVAIRWQGHRQAEKTFYHSPGRHIIID
jgi:FtsZ-interacting cell division protein ZipA